MPRRHHRPPLPARPIPRTGPQRGVWLVVLVVCALVGTACSSGSDGGEAGGDERSSETTSSTTPPSSTAPSSHAAPPRPSPGCDSPETDEVNAMRKDLTVGDQ